MTFSFNGIEIHYEIYGEGRPLLMLNGIMMTTKSWSRFVEPISQHFQLILVDFIDQGLSGQAQSGYTQAIQVELVKALLEHLELENVILFGISYGGEVGLRFASTYPSKVNRLIVANTCAETNYWLKEIGRSWIESMHSPLAFYLATIPIIYSPYFFNEQREWMENRKDILLDIFKQETYLCRMKRLIESAEGYDVKDKLDCITAPTLVIGAEYDSITPLLQQTYLYKQIIQSSFVVIPECGHASMYEKPTEFLSILLGYAMQDNDIMMI